MTQKKMIEQSKPSKMKGRGVDTTSIPTSSVKQSQQSWIVTLMKPHTWFAPAWAFLVGAVASGQLGFDLSAGVWHNILWVGRLAIGIGMAGPLLTGFSQVLNDYFDRDVDAINEPGRLIPSGKVTKPQVMILVFVLLGLALAVAAALSVQVFWVALLGVLLAIAYSAPPLRLKRNGWIGNLAVAIAYEGLAWIAGHFTFATSITSASLIFALLYSFSVHGVMTINDFKSVAGDRAMGIQSIPALYGERRAAWLAVITIDLAQIVVIGLLVLWGNYISAAIVFALLIVQLFPQRQLIRNPVNAMAIRYNIIAIPPLVWGMLAAVLQK